MLIRVAKGTLKVAVVAAVLAVAAVGAFRMLLARLPAYEGELAAWIDERLGVRLEFAELDARWGIEGPELTLRRASVTAPDQQAPFLTAREVRVGVSPFGLVARYLTQRELAIERLTFEGTALAVVRTADGAFQLRGAPDASTDDIRFDFAVPPNVDVRIRDSRLSYVDAARDTVWDFEDVAATLRREGDALVLDGAATPPAALGKRVSVAARGVIARDGFFDTRAEWRAFAEVAGLDLAAAAELLGPLAPGITGGAGDVAVALGFARGAIETATLRLALENVALADVAGAAGAAAAPPFTRIALTAEWQASRAGWRAAVSDVELVRAGRSWPAGARAEVAVSTEPDGRRIEFASSFLRLEDLAPFVALAPSGPLVDAWRALAPRGDARNVELMLSPGAARPDYAVAARFEALALEEYRGLPALEGLAGEVRADARSGRLVLEAGTALLAPSAFVRQPIDVTGLAGTLVWREGQDAWRIVGDDLVATTADVTTRTSLELTWPRDGSSPVIDLETEVPSFDLAAVPRYLPAGKMPVGVVAWLDGALRGGRAANARVTLFGPLAAFPFDGGEGELRVVVPIEDGVLAFVKDWPVAEELDGTVEFVNASFAARGRGRVLGNRAANLRVGIADLRRAELTLQGETIGPLGEVLGFLNGAPLVAQFLGPDFARLEAPGGTGAVALDLNLPLYDRSAYTLAAELDITDGELAYAGFGPRITEIRGSIALADREVSGENLSGIFLDGPITARIAPAERPGYRTRIEAEGEVVADAVASTFGLPYADLLRGQTRWRGEIALPDPTLPTRAPARITVESNLSGVASRLPAPFSKTPGEATNVQVTFEFPAAGGLTVAGNWGATRRFAAQLDSVEADAATVDAGRSAARSDTANGALKRLELRRAALRFGGAAPALDFARGVRVDGRLPVLSLDDWLALPPRGGEPLEIAFAGAELDVDEFTVFGQALGPTELDVRKRTSDWQLDVESTLVAGTVLVPDDLDADAQIVAVMRRLYLRGGNGSGSLTGVDPRALPGLQLHADDFALGTRRLGRLDAELLPDPLGLRLVSFESASPSFTASGSGSWLAGAEGTTTRLAVTLASTDVAATLDALGFDPSIEGESAQVTASVFWPGAPAADWLAHVGGDVALRADSGRLIDVQPGGAGRMAGLLSFSALPRRLALDFRDVFSRGFAFDEITADFVVVDGNAYTDNLKLTGPTAEIGIVGRTGLRDRDYRQQAVVTAEPGKMLPTVGGLIGGPGVAAALLIFTRIFKEPLKGIGRAAYCVTGSWQAPEVARLDDPQLGAACAELPPGAASQAP